MSDSFDPYYQWLSIPPDEQPPSLYKLIGVAEFEENREAISNAVDVRMAYVRTFQLGKRSAESQQLLNEIAAAGARLLSSPSKRAYDAELRADRAAAAAAKLPSLPALPDPFAAQPAVKNTAPVQQTAPGPIYHTPVLHTPVLRPAIAEARPFPVIPVAGAGVGVVLLLLVSLALLPRLFSAGGTQANVPPVEVPTPVSSPATVVASPVPAPALPIEKAPDAIQSKQPEVAAKASFSEGDADPARDPAGSSTPTEKLSRGTLLLALSMEPETIRAGGMERLIQDLGPRKLEATLSGGQEIPGIAGRGLKFGRQHCITAPLPLREIQSISGWFRMPPIAKFHSLFAGGGNFNGYAIDSENGEDLQLVMGDGKQWGVTRLPVGGFNDQQWHHLVFLLDQADRRFGCFLDSKLIASEPFPNEPKFDDLPFTVSSNWDGNFFVGEIDEVAVFSHLLSAAEVELLYRAGRAGRGLSEVLGTK